MNVKNAFSALILAGAMLSTVPASAATLWQWSGTLSDWANANYGYGQGGILDQANGPRPQTPPNVEDPNMGDAGPTYVGTVDVHGGDGDTTFTLVSTLGDWIGDAPNIRVIISEIELNGLDYYSLNFSKSGSSLLAGQIRYNIATTDPDGLAKAILTTDINPNNGGSGTKDIYAPGGNVNLLHLFSSNSPDSGSFGPLMSFDVVDTITVGNSQFNSLTNSFVEVVPEPLSLSLFGIGLAAMLCGRRRCA